MSNGIITCKCGHEEFDVPEPHPQWTCPVPGCRRIGMFTWEYTPLAGVLTATNQIMMSLSNMGINFLNKESIVKKEIIDIIEKQTGVAELLDTMKYAETELMRYGNLGAQSPVHLRIVAAIAKAEVTP